MDQDTIDLTHVQILLVDDEPASLRLLRQTLELEGHSILVATDCEGALRIAASAHPDLILLDVTMAGVDGFEVCRRLKKEVAEIPVIFVTARDDIGDILEGFGSGGVDYIIKPFQTEEVRVRVETHIGISRLIRKLRGSENELQRANRQLREEIARLKPG